MNRASRWTLLIRLVPRPPPPPQPLQEVDSVEGQLGLSSRPRSSRGSSVIPIAVLHSVSSSTGCYLNILRSRTDL